MPLSVSEREGNGAAAPGYSSGQAEAADDEVAHIRDLEEDPLLGTSGSNAGTPDAESVHDDDDAALFGTHDYNKVVEDGVPWIPPEEPTPEGRDLTS